MSSISFSRLILNFSLLNVSVLSFSTLFQFLCSVSCAIINETLSFVCGLNALLLFDESKGGENLEALKLIIKSRI